MKAFPTKVRVARWAQFVNLSDGSGWIQLVRDLLDELGKRLFMATRAVEFLHRSNQDYCAGRSAKHHSIFEVQDSNVLHLSSDRFRADMGGPALKASAYSNILNHTDVAGSWPDARRCEVHSTAEVQRRST